MFWPRDPLMQLIGTVWTILVGDQIQSAQLGSWPNSTGTVLSCELTVVVRPNKLAKCNLVLQCFVQVL